ncbi:ASN_collapsed_G0028050.mRNA.1.CDS.1 [Saccharomyces cerevisiae]|nr:ASN_collapsed_G0028050.mRNA.1.CDS.1 [Saccharomyces cerevisiae]
MPINVGLPEYQLQQMPTTASINSSTNATTTEGTNSSTNATLKPGLPLPAPTPALMLLTLKVPTRSAKEDANKDGNAEDNRFHPVTDINKEPYKRKGSQMVLLEKETESTISQYFREYECLTVSWIFGLTKLNIFSSMVLTYTSAQREYSHNTDYARAVKRCSSSVSVGLARKYRIGGWLGKH